MAVAWWMGCRTMLAGSARGAAAVRVVGSVPVCWADGVAGMGVQVPTGGEDKKRRPEGLLEV
jgi:hypothetical protein